MRTARRSSRTAVARSRRRRARGASLSARSCAARPLAFPRDHGSHPEFRTEWWYVTGLVRDARRARARRAGDVLPQPPGRRRGRREPLRAAAAPVRARGDRGSGARPAAPRPARRARGVRSRRRGRSDDARVASATGRSRWTATRTSRASPRAISRSTLRFARRSRRSLQGDGGYSRKGPRRAQASYYYSRPQLDVVGTLIVVDGRARDVTGRAWLDHEWSSEYMAARSARLGLDRHQPRRRRRADGVPHARSNGRRATGRAARARSATGATRRLRSRSECASRRAARGARRARRSPIRWQFDVRCGRHRLRGLAADGRSGARLAARRTGTIYWEGAVRATQAGRPAGRGYLELTGYGSALKL